MLHALTLLFYGFVIGAGVIFGMIFIIVFFIGKIGKISKKMDGDYDIEALTTAFNIYQNELMAEEKYTKIVNVNNIIDNLKNNIIPNLERYTIKKESTVWLTQEDGRMGVTIGKKYKIFKVLFVE